MPRWADASAARRVRSPPPPHPTHALTRTLREASARPQAAAQAQRRRTHLPVLAVSAPARGVLVCAARAAYRTALAERADAPRREAHLLASARRHARPTTPPQLRGAPNATEGPTQRRGAASGTHRQQLSQATRGSPRLGARKQHARSCGAAPAGVLVLSRENRCTAGEQAGLLVIFEREFVILLMKSN